jgi:hypothetical protein
MSHLKKANLDQFVLLNQIFTHDEETLGHIFVFSGEENLPKAIPQNWNLPVNFSEGKLHIRVKVMSKPTKAKVRYMLYLMSGGHGDQYRAVVGHNLVEFTEPGTYDFEENVSSIFDQENINWARPLHEMIVSVWDKNNFPVETRWSHGGKWEGSPHLSLYYPMKVHYTAVVVAKGGKFRGWPSRFALLQEKVKNRLKRLLKS